MFCIFRAREETVSVSLLTGALGLIESSVTWTVREPVAALSGAAASAAWAAVVAAVPESRPAIRGAPTSSDAVRRSHRRAGDGPIP